MDKGSLAIGFDMDGTLLRTDVDYAKIFWVVYDGMMEAGVPKSELSQMDGPRSNIDIGVEYLVKAGRSEDVPMIMERIRKGMKDVELENHGTARPYEGAERMLQYLKDKGYRIGVLTRGSREYATKALTVAGVMDMLDALVCRDDGDESEAKPSPIAMERLAAALGVRTTDILYIGDHRMDYICARDSGAGFIGVLTRNIDDYWSSVDRDITVIDTVTDLMRLL